MIPIELQNAFYAGERGNLVKFCVNDAVEVVAGEFAGKRCAVISILEIEPEVVFHLERGDDGSSIRVQQKALKLI